MSQDSSKVESIEGLYDQLFDPLIRKHRMGTMINAPNHESVTEELEQLKRKLIAKTEQLLAYDSDYEIRVGNVKEWLIGEHS